MDQSQRRKQLRTVAETDLRALAQKDFDAIPYDEDVVLRSPLAPPNLALPYEAYPVTGRAAVVAFFQGLAPALGETRLIDCYFNENLTAVCAEAEVGIVEPSATLRVIDRFIVNEQGRITDQENHYDPRPVLPAA